MRQASRRLINRIALILALILLFKLYISSSNLVESEYPLEYFEKRDESSDIDIFSNETIIAHNKIGYTKNFTGIFTRQLSASFEASIDSTVVIHVFAWRRYVSLKRLLNSLVEAKYLGKQVPLYIHVDGGYSNKVAWLIRNFVWPHGPLKVIKSQKNRGLQVSITNAWKPESDTEYAIFLVFFRTYLTNQEDDTQVSPLYYKFSVWCMLHYLKMKHDHIAGCSLYSPRINEILATDDPQHPPPVSFANQTESKLILLQLPCSWGSIMRPDVWSSFLDYYKTANTGQQDVHVPRSRSNSWSKSWKRFLHS
jgi:hypothetical protein